MANDIKKIFKDQVIGTPKSELILDNKIKGVFGNVANVARVSVALTNLNINNEYTLSSMSYGVLNSDNTNYNMYVRAFGRYTHTFIYNIPISLKYSEPIENITPDKISARLVLRRIDNIGADNLNTTEAWAKAFYDHGVVGLPPLFPLTENIPVNGNINYPLPSPELYSTGETERVLEIIDLNESLKITSFSIDFDFKINFTIEGDVDIYYISYTAGGAESGNSARIYQPLYIEITVLGDTYQITSSAFQIGEKTNAFEISQNSLLTNKSMYKTTPLYQHLANKIINEWHDGKQTVSLSKVINNNSDILKVDDDVVVLNARESDFTDINEQSIARKRDGTAKKFNVTTSEFNYDGSYRQIIDMSEKTIEED